MKLLFFTGSWPELSRNELAAVLGVQSGQFTQLEKSVLALEIDGDSGFPGDNSLQYLHALQLRLGGTTKIAVELACMPKAVMGTALFEQVKAQSGERLTFAIGAVGQINTRYLTGMISQELKKQGVKVRFIEAKNGSEVSSAQTFTNKLALMTAKGEVQTAAREYVLVQDGANVRISVVATVQDIAWYSKRDIAIPKPDPVSGMLPPKLAQMMVNLAVGTDVAPGVVVYDPFCGNGRVVSEAWLLGGVVRAVGSDIHLERSQDTTTNLEWVAAQVGKTLPTGPYSLQLDATNPEQQLLEQLLYTGGIPDPLYIVAEPFLGMPLRSPLQSNQKQAWLEELSKLYLGFFEQWKPGVRDVLPKAMVVVFPRTKTQAGEEVSVFGNLVDKLSQIGYSTVALGCYQRPDSYIARDIIRITYRS